MRLLIILFFPSLFLFSQEHTIQLHANTKQAFECTFILEGEKSPIEVNQTGKIVFTFPEKKDSVRSQLYCISFEPIQRIFYKKDTNHIHLQLVEITQELNEVQITQQRIPIRLTASPLTSIELDAHYFEKNPVTNLLDMMPQITGVRQQINCNVCGTGDIHINGLEGPYTLVVLDDVPLIGGLSSVYGLSGIPSFFLESLEVTKGPASSAFGSESIGGVIRAKSLPASNQFQVGVQQLITSNLESTSDFGINIPLSKKLSVFTSGQFGYLNTKLDANGDQFTDIPLYNRTAAFQRWTWDDTNGFFFQLSGKFLLDNRWGGQLNWNETWLGSDSIYGESIRTEREEIQFILKHQKWKSIRFLQHVNRHRQTSYYGTMPFHAKQHVSFSQFEYRKKGKKRNVFAGMNLRMMQYNDNTVLTQSFLTDQDSLQQLIQPGVFWEENWKWNSKQHSWFSVRLDFHPVHGFIPTPRLAHQFSWKKHEIRFQAGTGFRVVNLFSEDHAALTGSRKVVLSERLNPERSWSFQASHEAKKTTKHSQFLWISSLFYTQFSNQIIANYDLDPNEIHYQNVTGFARTMGIQHDFSFIWKNSFTFQVGLVMQDVQIHSEEIQKRPVLTERFSGNMSVSYLTKNQKWNFDYTHFWIGSMRLPLLSELDPRPEFSRPYIIHSLQTTYHLKKNMHLFFGIKNIFNWTPNRGIPFLIARAHDPFDKEVITNQNGSVQATSENPYSLTFDPTYVYASNEGIRFFIGFRWRINQK